MSQELKKILRNYDTGKKLKLLFSGGVDSSAILAMAMQEQIPVVPVWVNNGLNRATEEEVREQARNLGAQDIEVLNNSPAEKVCQNPPKRCFYCKSDFLSAIQEKNQIITDGTTASDLGNYRPGLEALKKFNVGSPLADAQISHDDAERIALENGADPHIAGLESCLATRVRYNKRITPDILNVIWSIERFIIDKTNDYDVRCRLDDDDHIRIEVKKPESYKLFAEEEFRKEIIDKANNITLFVTMDLKPTRPNEYDKRVASGEIN